MVNKTYVYITEVEPSFESPQLFLSLETNKLCSEEFDYYQEAKWGRLEFGDRGEAYYTDYTFANGVMTSECGQFHFQHVELDDVFRPGALFELNMAIIFDDIKMGMEAVCIWHTSKNETVYEYGYVGEGFESQTFVVEDKYYVGRTCYEWLEDGKFSYVGVDDDCHCKELYGIPMSIYEVTRL